MEGVTSCALILTEWEKALNILERDIIDILWDCIGVWGSKLVEVLWDIVKD